MSGRYARPTGRAGLQAKIHLSSEKVVFDDFFAVSSMSSVVKRGFQLHGLDYE
jgi:hypothetical protein